MKDFVKGSTTDAKFTSINKTLQHFSRRLHRTVLTISPPYPILHYVDQPGPDGVVYRFVAPVPGVITKGCVVIDRVPENCNVNIFATVIEGGDQTTVAFPIKAGKPLLMEPNFKVSAGSRISLSVKCDEEIGGIWVGFAYQIDRAESESKNVLIDELEKLTEKGLKG